LLLFSNGGGLLERDVENSYLALNNLDEETGAMPLGEGKSVRWKIWILLVPTP
jgi:hypothetical protein